MDKDNKLFNPLCIDCVLKEDCHSMKPYEECYGFCDGECYVKVNDE